MPHRGSSNEYPKHTFSCMFWVQKYYMDTETYYMDTLLTETDNMSKRDNLDFVVQEVTVLDNFG